MFASYLVSVFGSLTAISSLLVVAVLAQRRAQKKALKKLTSFSQEVNK